jgi:hypothetical protein
VQVVLYSKIPIDALEAHDLPTKRVVAVAEAFEPFLSIVVRVNRFHGRTVSMDGLFRWTDCSKTDYSRMDCPKMGCFENELFREWTILRVHCFESRLFREWTISRVDYFESGLFRE